MDEQFFVHPKWNGWTKWLTSKDLFSPQWHDVTWDFIHGQPSIVRFQNTSGVCIVNDTVSQESGPVVLVSDTFNWKIHMIRVDYVYHRSRSWWPPDLTYIRHLITRLRCVVLTSHHSTVLDCRSKMLDCRSKMLITVFQHLHDLGKTSWSSNTWRERFIHLTTTFL